MFKNRIGQNFLMKNVLVKLLFVSYYERGHQFSSFIRCEYSYSKKFCSHDFVKNSVYGKYYDMRILRRIKNYSYSWLLHVWNDEWEYFGELNCVYPEKLNTQKFWVKTDNFYEIKIENFHFLFQIIWGTRYTKKYCKLNTAYFRMQVSESGLAIHPSPAKHLMRPSLAFFEIF